jgi:hypothetical protein
MNSNEASPAWWRNDLWIPFVAGIFLILAWCLQRGWIVADHNAFLQWCLPREWVVTNHAVALGAWVWCMWWRAGTRFLLDCAWR